MVAGSQPWTQRGIVGLCGEGPAESSRPSVRRQRVYMGDDGANEVPAKPSGVVSMFCTVVREEQRAWWVPTSNNTFTGLDLGALWSSARLTKTCRDFFRFLGNGCALRRKCV